VPIMSRIPLILQRLKGGKTKWMKSGEVENRSEGGQVAFPWGSRTGGFER